MTDEKLDLRYIPLSQARRWDENPKRHDLDAPGPDRKDRATEGGVRVRPRLDLSRGPPAVVEAALEGEDVEAQVPASVYPGRILRLPRPGAGLRRDAGARPAVPLRSGPGCRDGSSPP